MSDIPPRLTQQDRIALRYVELFLEAFATGELSARETVVALGLLRARSWQELVAFVRMLTEEAEGGRE
jgi:hypothetical protein